MEKGRGRRARFIDKESINKKDLLNVLDLLKPGLSGGKSIMEQTTHYLFMKDRIATYNEDVCLVVPFPIRFSGSVKEDEFYKLISKVSADKIQLTLEENQIIMKAGKSSFGLAYEQPGEIHEMIDSLEHDKLKWIPLPEGAKDAIVLCSFSASKDMTKPSLAGVFINDNDILSSDAHRISWSKLEKGLEESFLIPASSAVHLMDYGLDKFYLSESWVHFKGKDLFFSIRRLEEEFPDNKVKEFFPKRTKEGFGLPKELAGILDKALVLLQEDLLLKKQVSLTFEDKEILCEVEKQDLGWFKEKIAMENDVEKMEIKVNPVFLKEILKHTTKIVPVDKGRLLFTSGNFRHLIALG